MKPVAFIIDTIIELSCFWNVCFHLLIRNSLFHKAPLFSHDHILKNVSYFTNTDVGHRNIILDTDNCIVVQNALCINPNFITFHNDINIQYFRFVYCLSIFPIIAVGKRYATVSIKTLKRGRPCVDLFPR